MDGYDIIKSLVLNHPDKDKILRVLNLCDDPDIPVVTQHAISKRSRISAPILSEILYFLSGIGMLSTEKVGRASVYIVTQAFGGRLLDELKGSAKQNA